MARLVALFSVATIAALALQTTVPRWLPTGWLVPDLVLILIVDLGLRHHGATPALMAFGIGYATDMFSGSQLGLNAFACTLVYFLAYEASRALLVRSQSLGAVLVFFGVLIKTILTFAISTGFASTAQIWPIVPTAVLQALITSFLALPVFSLLTGSKRILGLPLRPARE